MRARPILAALAAKGLMLGALAALNRSLELDDLPPTLPGGMRDWLWRLGRVRYTTLGDGPPLILLHGPHAAASSYEMRNVFEPLADRFTVYAPDLLGFGKSERPAIDYAGTLYADLVTDFVDQVVGRPCAIVASSLSAAYAVAAAGRRPGLVSRLVLVCPTGDARATRIEAVAGALYWFLRLPIQGRAAFNALVSRPSIRAYLRRRVYFDPACASEQVVEQHWATAHQPNARFAPAAFVGGRLSLPLRPGFARLTQPVLLVWGAEARLPAIEEAAALQALNPGSRLHVVERCGLLPHDERADAFIAAAAPFLAE